MRLLGTIHKILSVRNSDLPGGWSARLRAIERLPATGSRQGWYKLAVAQGALCPGVGQAFAGGYQCALRRLFGAWAGNFVSGLVAFGVTEEKGGHPRSILTRLSKKEGQWQLCGSKSFVTMAPEVDRLLVVARTGEHNGRPRLKVVSLDTNSPGLVWGEPFVVPFVPDITHCTVSFDCSVRGNDILPGDGYARWVKPFRTVEDLHVMGATGGLFLSQAHSFGLPRAVQELAANWLVAGGALAGASPRSEITHIALAGWLQQGRELLTSDAAFWQKMPENIRQQWQRDTALFGIAAKAREARRLKAWSMIGA